MRGRIREAMGALKRMQTFWRHSNCTLNFTLNVIQAVLFSKVLVRLESAELQATALQALDVFHLKCLRKVHKMETTYVNRANTNQEVLKRGSEQIREGKKIKMLSQVYTERKQLFLDKVAMADESDPIRRITFQDNSMEPIIHRPRRVGRPKAKLANEECKIIWDKIQQHNDTRVQYDENSIEAGQNIREWIGNKAGRGR